MNRREFIAGTGAVPLAATILPEPSIAGVGYPDHTRLAYEALQRAMAHFILAAKAETQLETSAQFVGYSEELMIARIECIAASKQYAQLKQAHEDMGVHTQVNRPFLTNTETRAILWGK